MEREWRPVEGERVRIVVPLQTFYLRRNTGRIVSLSRRGWFMTVHLDDPALRLYFPRHDVSTCFFQSIVVYVDKVRPIGEA